MSETDTLCDDFISFLIDVNPYDDDDDRTMHRDFLEKFVPMILWSDNFTVNLQDLAEALETREDNLKVVLLNEAKEGRDYEIKIEKKVGRGRPKNHILMTRDCVKRVATRSQTKKAKQVLTYLITMEDAYAEFMLNGMQDRRAHQNDELDDRRAQVEKPKRGDFVKGHCIYVIECMNENGKTAYKLGRTKDLFRRAMEHWHGLTKFIKVIYQKVCVNHQFMEVCGLTGLGKLRCESEILITNPQKIIETFELCAKLNAELCEKTGMCAKTDEEEMSKNLFGTTTGPFQKEKKKKKKATESKESE